MKHPRFIFTAFFIAAMAAAISGQTAETPEHVKKLASIKRIVAPLVASANIETLATVMVRSEVGHWDVGWLVDAQKGLTAVQKAEAKRRLVEKVNTDYVGMIVEDLKSRRLLSDAYEAKLVEFYDREFTAGEIEELVAFMESDVGKKLTTLGLKSEGNPFSKLVSDIRDASKAPSESMLAMLKNEIREIAADLKKTKREKK